MRAKNYSRVFRLLFMLTVAISLFAFGNINKANAQRFMRNIQHSHCTLTIYYLHGKDPATSKCENTAPSTSGNLVRPYTNTIECSNFPSNLEIDSNQNGRVCFTGYGYLGLSGCCTGVYYMTAELAASGWVLYYYPRQTGQRLYFTEGGATWNHQYPLDGNATITQVCINSGFINYC